MTYYTRQTPDYSPLVVHFTRRGPMVEGIHLEETHPLHAFEKTKPYEKLLSILRGKVIWASPMPEAPGDARAVCFTECIWRALVELSKSYSCFGVVFMKDFIFGKGGGPAFYVRGDLLAKSKAEIPERLCPFITPFDPEKVLRKGVVFDFLHEREWRLPGNLRFEYENIRFVIVETIADAEKMVSEVGEKNLPREKLIPMDVYKTIQEAWGT